MAAPLWCTLAMTRKLAWPSITLDEDLPRETTSREPFDQLMAELLARAGMVSEQVAAGVQRATITKGLDRDQAVLGGLLVRMGKLTRGVLDSTQAEESEAHLVLSRSATETAITLMWLIRHGSDDSLRRFRADSFAYWRKQLQRMRSPEVQEDKTMRSMRERTEQHVAFELSAAGVGWDDVPEQSNSWGPDMRQRCGQLGLSWVYPAYFASHSSYVHPSWHELRTFHLACDGDLVQLESTFGGMVPVAGYVLARLVAEACQAAAEVLPCDVDQADLQAVVKSTVRASQVLAIHFSDFISRGGVDEYLHGSSG
jgi:hypothetical protein